MIAAARSDCQFKYLTLSRRSLPLDFASCVVAIANTYPRGTPLLVHGSEETYPAPEPRLGTQFQLVPTSMLLSNWNSPFWTLSPESSVRVVSPSSSKLQLPKTPL